MPNVKDLRRRIRSVENTGKVTNAMSLVAASKMRRAQQAVTQGRPFAEKIIEVIAHLAAHPRVGPLRAGNREPRMRGMSSTLPPSPLTRRLR